MELKAPGFSSPGCKTARFKAGLRLGILLVASLWVPLVYAELAKADLVNTDLVKAGQKDWTAEQLAVAHQYLDEHMWVPPLLPANLDNRNPGCDLPRVADSTDYRSATEVDYSRPGWEQRVAADWTYFRDTPPDTRLTVIDFRQSEAGLTYRYLADGRQDELYEPWSSSKVQAFTALLARLRRDGLGGGSRVGGVPLADLISSVHSYDAFGLADGNSNAIASWFLNIAGRRQATALFHDDWLKLANPAVRFQGAYGTEEFRPPSDQFVDPATNATVTIPSLSQSGGDPDFQDYRCPACGLTGNKPMTTLAQAEWLKRLAAHEREPATRHPGLTTSDIETLFYGTGHSDSQARVGGMLVGITRILSNALGEATAGVRGVPAKFALDQANNGRWRIFQKVGSGPSETRGRTEVVMLAHVCLPGWQGGREFTLAATSSVPGESDDLQGAAGEQMEQLFVGAFRQLLNAPE